MVLTATGAKPGSGNLRGGTVGFNALLTCGGSSFLCPLKYKATDRRAHGHSTCSDNRSVVAHRRASSTHSGSRRGVAWFFTRYIKRPKLEVKVYQELATQRNGSPPPKLRRIFFQVRNVGKSKASDCRVELSLPKRTDSAPPIPVPAPIETYDYLRNNIELEWFRYVGGLGDVEDESSLGKSIDISPHPNVFFFAGTILVEKVETSKSIITNAILTIRSNIYESSKLVVTDQRQLRELSHGGSLDLDVKLTWLRDWQETRTLRYRLEVKSFDEVNFTQVSDC